MLLRALARRRVGDGICTHLSGVPQCGVWGDAGTHSRECTGRLPSGLWTLVFGRARSLCTRRIGDRVTLIGGGVRGIGSIAHRLDQGRRDTFPSRLGTPPRQSSALARAPAAPRGVPATALTAAPKEGLAPAPLGSARVTLTHSGTNVRRLPCRDEERRRTCAGSEALSARGRRYGAHHH